MKQRYPGVLLLVGLLTLQACGGSGGEDDETVVYTGNRNIASLDLVNASRLAINVTASTMANNPAVADLIVPAMDRKSIFDNPFPFIVAQRISGRLENALGPARVPQGNTASRQIDYRVRCESGNVDITGNIDANGVGTVYLDYRDCSNDHETLDGEVEVRIVKRETSVETDAHYDIGILRARIAGQQFSIAGSIRSHATTAAGSKRLTTRRLVMRDDGSGRQVMLEDLVEELDFDQTVVPTTLSQTILSGRVYDSVHGYVDVSTVQPLFYTSIEEAFPGEGILLLSGDGSLRLNAKSSDTLWLEIDAGNDGDFETEAVVPWQDLDDAAGSGLADTDGDGMHDGWEDAHGFDPEDDADAGLDSDGDGIVNLVEYESGSDPTDPGSVPTADLWISAAASAEVLRPDQSFDIGLTVRNNGPDQAEAVQVILQLAPGLVLQSATPDRGGCSGSTTVICDLGWIPLHAIAEINVAVHSTAQGELTSTASISGSGIDPQPLRDTARATVHVGNMASDIQDRIDAANDGDTILVPPGVYYGGIDFNGKAITVASEAGPETTVIDARLDESVATFDSAETDRSVLRGFTLRNGFSFVGGGVEINDASPSLIDNIIDSNVACFGAGVGIGTSLDALPIEPVLRGNRITNNQGFCFGESSGGGVWIGGLNQARVIGNEISGNHADHAGGIYLNFAHAPLIRDNRINDNTGGAIWLNDSSASVIQNEIARNSGGDCGGIGLIGADSSFAARIVNNSIIDNEGTAASAICSDGWNLLTEVSNNIIAAIPGQTAVSCQDQSGQELAPPTFLFNNVFADGGALYAGNCENQTGANGNISAASRFVDRANGDYRLGAGSSDIDAGFIGIPGLPDTDIEGNDRFVDGDGDFLELIDIGAYEYSP